MWRKRFELRIVLAVKATMGDEKHAPFTRGISKLSDIGKQTLCTGHVQLAAGKHKVGLRVDFPENHIARCHAIKLITSFVRRDLLAFESAMTSAGL